MFAVFSGLLFVNREQQLLCYWIQPQSEFPSERHAINQRDHLCFLSGDSGVLLVNSLIDYQQ